MLGLRAAINALIADLDRAIAGFAALAISIATGRCGRLAPGCSTRRRCHSG